jgi:hypothetical protein
MMNALPILVQIFCFQKFEGKFMKCRGNGSFLKILSSLLIYYFFLKHRQFDSK